MEKRFITLIISIFTYGFLFLTSGEEVKFQIENIARGCKYALTPAQNYWLCTEKNDMIQLTDGIKYSGPDSLWIQKGCVGWAGVEYPRITVDLGKTFPISGVSLHTAFDGPINVIWPSSILVFVSEDNREFHYVCDLVNPMWPMSYPLNLPTIDIPLGQKLTFYEYSNKQLETKGRFVSFAIHSDPKGKPPYIFCDEIEIYKGSDSFLSKNYENPPVNIDQAITRFFTRKALHTVFNNDLSILKNNAKLLGIHNDFKQLHNQIEEFQGLDTLPDKIIVPINDIQSNILKANAEFMRKSNYPPLVAWMINRWQPIHSMEIPPKNHKASLSFELMRRECRAEALNITNTDKDDAYINLKISGLPYGVKIKVHQVEFTGTVGGHFIADALPEIKKNEDIYHTSIPSGMTRQIWLNCFSQNTAAGVYNGYLTIENKKQVSIKIPISIKIHPFEFPDNPSLSLIVWDYTDKPYGFRGMTDKNVRLAIEDMEEHYVNIRYAHAKAACWPKPEDFDEYGNMTGRLETAVFDEWIDKQQKDNKIFFFYVGDSRLKKFAGEPIGTKRFERMLKQWILQLVRHAKSKGINENQLGMHLVDEPPRPPIGIEGFKINTIYGNIIREVAPEINILANPIRYDEARIEMMEMLKSANIFTVSIPTFYNKMNIIKHTFEKADGCKKKFYMHSGTEASRLKDPYFFYRVAAWQCLKNDAVGLGFWCYWNDYAMPGETDWNEVLFSTPSWGYVYKADDSIITSKRWEAVREGIEDYEYFTILKRRIEGLKAQNIHNEIINNAELLCISLPEIVTVGYEGNRENGLFLEGKGSRNEADNARIKIIDMLYKLKDLDKNTSEIAKPKKNH